MSRHVVVGRGPVGRSLARELLDQGHEVLVLSRSGGPLAWRGGRHPEPPTGTLTTGVVDATDASALTRAAAGADALHVCVNPAYHRWPVDWPPLTDAFLRAAERTGAVLVVAGNLYGYGAVQLMTEDSPQGSTESKGRVRAEAWAEAERRHRAGLVRATEVRAADYLGPEAEDHAHAGPRLLRPLLAGRTLHPVGRPDVPHTWTYLPDLARAMVAAAVRPEAWGRPWHAPSPEPLTVRELARRFTAAAGLPEPTVRPVPMALVRLLGVAQPSMRELAAVGHQHTRPFVMDSARSQAVLGLAPTPWDRVVAETLAAFDPAAPAVSRF